ncbi:phage tail assembly protein [Pigmentiphaga sp. CHJ604]|uniref:phage tail assembly protein n=1 Tax=Pigmentiphaga sp. CHJ604 TaxID=3081984 RepID=UPI0030CBC134
MSSTPPNDPQVDTLEPPPAKPSITLDTPVVRGKTTIKSVELVRPTAGQLKGISLVELAQLNADALVKLLPRITVPPLLAHEAAALGAPDLMAFGIEVASFLMSKSEKAAVQAQLDTLP